MWKDNNDKIDELYGKIKEINFFPATCPLCGKKEAHIYMHIYNNKTKRGGLWIWCSSCYIFSHSSLHVPKYWINLDKIELEKLVSYPNYLEENKMYIDEWVNEILAISKLSE